MPDSTSPPDRFERSLEPTPAAASASRRAFTDWLTYAGAVGDSIADMTVVFSELVNNATEASHGLDDHPVNASAWREHGNVVVEVTNPIASTSPDFVRPDRDDPLRGSGRGLIIVQAYTDSVEILTDDLGTLTVRCERRLQD